ncbi:hypothetical protein FA13DRAFT_1726320 [Coprinellus micaceus]|uniref:Uncharacterized protein n=1 Tax=Coprinellus micaceus TaxID=71717 RepID=A0A4Y7TTH9_COPMI|nr:hypothetical protein FA13DRAFT_1726320 [Coprinellus micaceus]
MESEESYISSSDHPVVRINRTERPSIDINERRRTLNNWHQSGRQHPWPSNASGSALPEQGIQPASLNESAPESR